MTFRQERFRKVLAAHFTILFETDPEYADLRHSTQPGRLAEVVIEGLTDGSGIYDGKAIRSTCQSLGLRFTKASIRAYLAPVSRMHLCKVCHMGFEEYDGETSRCPKCLAAQHAAAERANA